MVPFPPNRRENSGERHARRWLFISSLCGSLAACAGLLDLPDEPYLAEPEPPEDSAPDGDEPRLPVDTGGDPRPSQGGGGSNSGFEVGMNNVQRDPAVPTTTPGEGSAPPLQVADAGADTPPEANAPPDAAAPASRCPTEATLGPNDRCYATVASVLVWARARAECQSIGVGWDLASIHDAATNDLVATLMPDEAWLGGSDAAFEGNWLWVSDNAPFWTGTGDTGAPVGGAFENWNSDEPNGGGPSDCMRLVAGLGTWADLQCTFERPAVCEGPAL